MAALKCKLKVLAKSLLILQHNDKYLIIRKVLEHLLLILPNKINPFLIQKLEEILEKI